MQSAGSPVCHQHSGTHHVHPRWRGGHRKTQGEPGAALENYTAAAPKPCLCVSISPQPRSKAELLPLPPYQWLIIAPLQNESLAHVSPCDVTEAALMLEEWVWWRHFKNVWIGSQEMDLTFCHYGCTIHQPHKLQSRWCWQCDWHSVRKLDKGFLASNIPHFTFSREGTVPAEPRLWADLSLCLRRSPLMMLAVAANPEELQFP